MRELVAKIAAEWGAPKDRVAWSALVVALVVLGAACIRSPANPAESKADRELFARRFLAVIAFAAAFLSLGYVAYYLRGAPRIIDATTYYLQGRALSHGDFAWHALLPSESVRGRFLLFREPDIVAGIFPPGYPLLLSLGFRLGAPLVVGPLIAMGLVFATYLLAGEVADHVDTAKAFGVTSRAVGVCAALASLVSAALRYHTADTMAHGASALAIALALTLALRGARLPKHASLAFTGAGLLVGYVAATRMASAPPIALVVIALAYTSSAKSFGARAARLAPFFLAIGPGLLLLAWSQREATGSFFTSTQRAYYAASDGPPGCFRYGFGAGIGCTFEHGDFVEAHLTHGYGFVAALGTTMRRLTRHASDIANFEPLALLVFVPLAPRIRAHSRAPSYLLALIALHLASYAPFYFDGNYPGGGARLYADVLPVEHALIAIALVAILPRVAYARRVAAFVAIALAGFAVHTSRAHAALADRDGGRPMYERAPLDAASASHGVVFFDTDHGFDLAYDPEASARDGLVAARFRDDDHDRLVVDHLGRPDAWVYRWDDGKPNVTPWLGGGRDDAHWSFEAEADWPPLAQSNGAAIPQWMNAACASKHRVLTLFAQPQEEAIAMIALDVPHPGRWTIAPNVTRRGGTGRGEVAVVQGATMEEARASLPLASWTWTDRVMAKDTPCAALHGLDVTLKGTPAYLVLHATSGDVSLDRTSLDASPPRVR